MSSINTVHAVHYEKAVLVSAREMPVPKIGHPEGIIVKSQEDRGGEWPLHLVNCYTVHRMPALAPNRVRMDSHKPMISARIPRLYSGKMILHNVAMLVCMIPARGLVVSGT